MSGWALLQGIVDGMAVIAFIAVVLGIAFGISYIRNN